jgi:hypothetical protein
MIFRRIRSTVVLVRLASSSLQTPSFSRFGESKLFNVFLIPLFKFEHFEADAYFFVSTVGKRVHAHRKFYRLYTDRIFVFYHTC